MDLSSIDFEGLGTAIAVLAKSNPIYALATGVISGIFGKALFDSKKAKKAKKQAESKEKEALLEHLRKVKEQDVSTVE